MAPRATWKGFLTLGELGCAVSLHAAVSTSGRVSFRTVAAETGHAVQRRYVDEDTGEEVDRDDQVKGYETASGDPVLLDAEEVAATQPESDRTLAIEGFLPCTEVDPVYFDRPYFLAPADHASAPAFALIRDALAQKSMTALAHAVLFRRARKLLLRAYEEGMVATTLHFDYEVRAESETFGGIKDFKVEGEMLELATHIIATKRGTVDVHAFEDRYEAAVVDLVRRKLEGKPIRKPKAPARGHAVSLLDALRESAGAAQGTPKGGKAERAQKAAKPGKAARAKRAAPAKTPPRRKAG